MTKPDLERYLRWRCVLDDPFVELDLSLGGMTELPMARLEAAMAAMAELERGAKANRAEDRMVGHYWLRAPARAPDAAISEEIAENVDRIRSFAADVHAGRIAPPEGGAFARVLLLGIGGSALGPLLLADAFEDPDGPMAFHLIDNSDPDGLDRELARIGTLADTLVLVTSKSGGTPETRNALAEVAAVCARSGIELAPRAVAITMPGSKLAAQAEGEGWLAQFPIPDWVGGRTSLFSSVGLLPAALLGLDLHGLLGGAAAMDEKTRAAPAQNPAAWLAAFWHAEGNGRGERAMVVLPYRDRLLLLSRYLQQLVMESLGKAQDREGRTVHQGLTVYGNKGSTDQHAFVQQLRDGRHDFFVQFVRVLQDRVGPSIEVEPGVTSGDFLDGFWQGTRQALVEAGRHSATLTVTHLDERTFGAVVALFERAVGLYAELIDVNAYDQPGVEAGKRAASSVLAVQRALLDALDAEPRSCAELAERAGTDPVAAWHVLVHLAANRQDLLLVGPPDPRSARFRRR